MDAQTHFFQTLVNTRVLRLTKIAATLSVPALIVAGLLRIPWKRWFPWFLIAETLWTGSLVLIGYYTTEAISHVAEGMEFVLLGVSLLFVTFLVVWGRRLLKRLEQEEADNLLS